MNRQERFESVQMALLTALQGWQSKMWTALPGIVQSFDPVKKTCVVQVAIQMLQTLQTTSGTNAGIDVSKQWLNIAPIHDVPVHFPSGGGFTLTFPVAAGDECLVVFSSRCIDAWWQNGAYNQSTGITSPQNQPHLRMHDLSDGFAFVGISSVPNVQSGISTNSVQLRSNDGATKIDLANGAITVTAATVTVNSTNATVNASTKAVVAAPEIDLNASTQLVVTTPIMNVSGNLNVSGTVIGAGKSLSTHSHNVAGVQTGTSTITSTSPN